jgi:hypothetical protein
MSEFLTKSPALDAPQSTIPIPRGPVPQAPPERKHLFIEIKIDGKPVSVQKVPRF